MAAEHLLDRGFKHYGFVGIPGRVWSDRRERGFRAGSPRPDSRPTSISRGSGRSAAAGLWTRKLSPSGSSLFPSLLGLMACNDDRGREVLEACRVAHIRVPEEIAVIGVDNDSLLCDLACRRFPALR